MPMIDVYAPSDLLPIGSDRRIGEELTGAVLRANGVSAPSPFHLDAGHGSLFQYPESFTRHAAAFLSSDSESAAF